MILKIKENKFFRERTVKRKQNKSKKEKKQDQNE